MHWNLGSIHGPLSLPIFDWTEVLWNQVLEGWGFRASEALFRNLRVTSQRRHPSVFTACGAHAAWSVTQPEWQTHTEDRWRHTQTVKSLWIFLMVGTDVAGFLLVCCQCVYVCQTDRHGDSSMRGGSKKINGLHVMFASIIGVQCWNGDRLPLIKQRIENISFTFERQCLNSSMTSQLWILISPHPILRHGFLTENWNALILSKISDITYIFTSTAAVHVVRAMTEQRLRSTSLPSLFQNWILQADMQRSSTICQHYLQKFGGFWSFHESVDV